MQYNLLKDVSISHFNVLIDIEKLGIKKEEPWLEGIKIYDTIKDRTITRNFIATTGSLLLKICKKIGGDEVLFPAPVILYFPRKISKDTKLFIETTKNDKKIYLLEDKDIIYALKEKRENDRICLSEGLTKLDKNLSDFKKEQYVIIDWKYQKIMQSLDVFSSPDKYYEEQNNIRALYWAKECYKERDTIYLYIVPLTK